MSASPGSSVDPSLCAESTKAEPVAYACSSARVDRSRTSNMGVSMRGKTMRSRVARRGSARWTSAKIMAPELGRFFVQFEFFPTGARDQGGLDAPLDDLFRDDALDHVAATGQFEHDVQERALDDGPQPSGTRVADHRLVGDRIQAVLREDQVHPVVGEELAILLDQGVLRFGQDGHEIVPAQLVHIRDDRQAADELRDQSELKEVFREHLREQLAYILVELALDMRTEPDALLPDAPLYDLLKSGERAAADEQDVRGVDAEELLVRVLAAPLRRYARRGALEDLQQSLLDPLTRHVPGD